MDWSGSKLILIIYNVLLICCGVALLAFGILFLVAINKWDVFLKSNVRDSGIILTVVGGIIVIVAILGIIGTCVIAATLHHIFVFLLILIIGTEIAGFVFAFQQNQSIQETITNQTSVTLIHSNGIMDYYDAWHRLQTEFECCGIQGPESWTQIFHKIPPACCNKERGSIPWTNNTGQLCAPSEVTFTNGCKQTFIDYWKKLALIIGAIGIAAMMYKVIGIAISCNQYNVIRDDE